MLRRILPTLLILTLCGCLAANTRFLPTSSGSAAQTPQHAAASQSGDGVQVISPISFVSQPTASNAQQGGVNISMLAMGSGVGVLALWLIYSVFNRAIEAREDREERAHQLSVLLIVKGIADDRR